MRPGGRSDGRNRAATRCNSGAGEAAGAGSVSPTVLPESEDGLLRGVLARVPSRLRPSGHRPWFPRLHGFGHGVGGSFGRNPPSHNLQDSREKKLKRRKVSLYDWREAISVSVISLGDHRCHVDPGTGRSGESPHGNCRPGGRCAIDFVLAGAGHFGMEAKSSLAASHVRHRTAVPKRFRHDGRSAARGLDREHGEKISVRPARCDETCFGPARS